MIKKICMVGFFPMIFILIMTTTRLVNYFKNTLGSNEYLLLGILLGANFLTLGVLQNKAKYIKAILGINIIILSLTVGIFEYSSLPEQKIERAEVNSEGFTDNVVEKVEGDKLYLARVRYVETESRATQLELKAAQLRNNGPKEFYKVTGWMYYIEIMGFVLLCSYGICWILYEKATFDSVIIKS